MPSVATAFRAALTEFSLPILHHPRTGLRSALTQPTRMAFFNTSTQMVHPSAFIALFIRRHALTSLAARLNCSVLQSTGLGIQNHGPHELCPEPESRRQAVPQRAGRATGPAGFGVAFEQSSLVPVKRTTANEIEAYHCGWVGRHNAQEGVYRGGSPGL